MAGVAMEPITMVTGLLGHGKTLYAVDLIRQCKEEGLQAFHLNINELKPEFAEHWAGPIEKWRDLPRGSVLVVDEAHNVFPKRPANAKEPEWIAKLAEIRHFGLRLIIITQDPRDLDAFVRRRVGVHYHVARKTGHAFAIVHEYRPHSDNPRSKDAQKTAQHKVWKYPKELYGSYKSAAQHMVKPKWPKKMLLFPILAIATIGGIIYAISFVTSLGGRAEERALDSGAPRPPNAVTAIGGMPTSTGQSSQQRTWSTAEEFAKLHTPVVAGVPWSAPVFSDRSITTVPDMHCVIIGEPESWKADCRCYTEQVTRLQVEVSQCRQAARGGVYNPYRQPMNASAPGVMGANAEGRSGAPVTPIAPASVYQPVSGSSQPATLPAGAAPPVPAFTGVR